MSFSVQLDTLATTFAFGFISHHFMKKWVESNPSEDEIQSFIHEMRLGMKSAHSENSIDEQTELLLVDRMLFHFDKFAKEYFPQAI